MGLQDDSLFSEGTPAPSDAERWSAAVRAAADRELTDTEVDALRAHDGSLDQRIAFERGLADAVNRSMTGVVTPAGLRDRVLATARAASDDTDYRETDPQDDALEAGLHARAADTRDPGFWAGSRRLIGALAAILVIAVGGVFIARLAQVGPAVAPTSGPRAGANAEDMLAYRTSLARFVTAEHERTLDPEYAQSKYIYKQVDEAVEQTGGQLEHKPKVPPCGGQINFRGAAPCGVPGKGPSTHFQFTVDEPEGERTISIFVRRDMGELEIERGRAYRVNTEACNLENTSIFVWRADGLLYTYVSAGPDDTICNKLLGKIGIREPDPDESL